MLPRVDKHIVKKYRKRIHNFVRTFGSINDFSEIMYISYINDFREKVDDDPKSH